MNHVTGVPRNAEPPPWAFRISAAVLSVAAVLLLRFPLLNSLGYEYAVAIAMILPVVIGPFVIVTLRRGSGRGSSFPAVVARLLRSVLLLVTIPLLIGAANSAVVKNCSLWEGFQFYLLIPVVTAVWLMALGVTCFAGVRKAILLYIVAVVLVLGYAAYVGYFSPQIYSYNFIFGFFPGVSYDEVLPVQPTLLLFRIVTLLAAAGLFLLAEYRWTCGDQIHPATVAAAGIHRWKKFPLLLFLTILLAGSWLFRTQLGFETTGSWLRSALSARITTPHFYIYYQPGSVPQDDVWRIAAEHEFRYSQIARALNIGDHRRITSYMYPTAELQYRLLGTRTTNISKPWLREIHLTMESWEQNLKHELVHAMAGEFGMPVIRAHYNIGLVEGLATAIADDFGNRTLRQYAASIKAFHVVDHPAELLSPVGFATHASTVSYLLMGSFCRYLLDEYGIERFKKLYHGGSPERVYQNSYEHLIAEWQTSLDTISVPQSWQAHTAYLFRRPSIFAKTCGRKIASLNQEGYARLSSGDPGGAKQIFTHAYAMSRNTDSYAGLIRAEYAMERYDSVTALIVQCDSAGTEALQPLFRLYGDAKWAAGDTARASGMYRRLLDYDLSDRYNESLLLRLMAVRDSLLVPVLRPVLTGLKPDSIKIRILDSLAPEATTPLVRYVRARMLMSAHEFDRARKDFDLLPPRWGAPLLDGIREESLGRIWFRLGGYERARAHFWESLNECGTDANRRDIDDWISRCEWYQRQAASFLAGENH
jgi:hypothetical protein